MAPFSLSTEWWHHRHGIPAVLPSFSGLGCKLAPMVKLFNFNLATFQALLPAALPLPCWGDWIATVCCVLDGNGRKTPQCQQWVTPAKAWKYHRAPFLVGFQRQRQSPVARRTSKPGAQSPIAATIHAIVVLFGLVALAGVLAYLPMSAMAALLVVAWNMSEAHKALHLVGKPRPPAISWSLLAVFITVIFDMVIAISGDHSRCLVVYEGNCRDDKALRYQHQQALCRSRVTADWAVLKINRPLPLPIVFFSKSPVSPKINKW